MPVFTFQCNQGHRSERLVRDREIQSVICPDCSRPARKEGVYQFGVIGVAPVPPSDRNYRQTFREYQEAAEEVAYGYERAAAYEEPVCRVDYLGEAVKKAKAKGAKVAV